MPVCPYCGKPTDQCNKKNDCTEYWEEPAIVIEDPYIVEFGTAIHEAVEAEYLARD